MDFRKYRGSRARCFCDGAGWEQRPQKKNGYEVSVVPIPTTSLDDDSAVHTPRHSTSKGPIVLAGHSYGGAVITEPGNDPKISRHRGPRAG